MKKLIFKVVVSAMLLPFAVIAAPVIMNSVQNCGFQVSVNQVSNHTISVEYHTDPEVISTFAEEGEVPVATRWIALDPASDISLKDIKLQTTKIPSDWSYNPNSSLSFHTSSIPVTIGEASIMKKIRFVPVTLHSTIQNNSGDYELVRRARLEIDIIGPPVDLSSLSYTVRQMWGDLLLNRDNPRRDQESVNHAATCIYVIPQDERVSELMQPLYQFRRLEGYNVVEMAHVGNIEWLMQDIRDRNEHGVYPVEYVCLVGDLGGEFSVPTFMRGTSDYPFGLLEGNDILPEAAVGRISYNTLPELRRIVEKIRLGV